MQQHASASCSFPRFDIRYSRWREEWGGEGGCKKFACIENAKNVAINRREDLWRGSCMSRFHFRRNKRAELEQIDVCGILMPVNQLDISRRVPSGGIVYSRPHPDETCIRTKRGTVWCIWCTFFYSTFYTSPISNRATCKTSVFFSHSSVLFPHDYFRANRCECKKKTFDYVENLGTNLKSKHT